VYGGEGDELGCGQGGYDPGDGDITVFGKCNGQFGACCFPDSSCQDGLTPEGCEDAGGLFNLCKECATFECPAYQGACCLLDGTCVVTIEDCCDELGAVFVGGGTDCGGGAGGEPINLLTWMEDHDPYGPGEAVAIDISGFAGATAQVEFRYYGDSWDWYVEVDDVGVPGAFFENFNAGIPAGWDRVETLPGTGFYWELNTTTGRPNYAGGDGTCMIANQDWYWEYPYDTSLFTPWFVVPDGATLNFIAAYNYLSSGEAFEVNIVVQEAATGGPCQNMDIKPGSCPNPYNRGSHGVLPVALVGMEDFDVTTIDASSVRLERADGVGGQVAPHNGPPGPAPVVEDVATPFYGDMCECDDLGGDGIDDLSLKFKSDDVTSELELDGMPGGTVVPLVLRANNLEGDPFVGSDCIWFVPPNVPPGIVTITSNVGGTWIDVYPHDNTLDEGGFADFERGYFVGQTVTLTADPTSQGRPFRAWVVDGVYQTYGMTTIEFTVPVAMTARAVYRQVQPPGNQKDPVPANPVNPSP
jgi:hypothetical protein